MLSKTSYLSLMGAAALALTLASGPAAAQFTVSIILDENGHAHFSNSSGFQTNLASGFQNDPGPGGLNNVLTYSLINPPGLVAGDVELQDPNEGGLILDILRFNPQQTCVDGSTGCLAFYSDNLDGFDSLADTVGPPGGAYNNVITLDELGLEGGTQGAIYTPLRGEPGFVAGAAGPVTYTFISDSAVPEPVSLSLMGAGLLGLAGLRRRKSA